jgi:DNA-directed RNA polymerase sigma subunit (sigma70/sigma32)
MAVLERMLMSGNYPELSLDSFVKILSVEDMSISMTGRYQKIVVAYYGLDHRNKCSSTAELALQYDVSKSRINYLRHAALKKLAKLVIFKNLHLLVQVKMMVDALAGESA